MVSRSSHLALPRPGACLCDAARPPQDPCLGARPAPGRRQADFC